MTWALWLVIGVVVVANLVLLWRAWASIEARAQAEERERRNRILQAGAREWPRSKGPHHFERSRKAPGEQP